MRVVLIGNPNSGKTSLFNALTAMNEPVGNWPGVTVEKKEHDTVYAGQPIQWVDLPGLYSLSAAEETGLDEQISAREIAAKAYDLIINVIDASALERHLYLTSQILELGCPVILILNKIDLAERKGIDIDDVELGVRLNCPVLRMDNKKQEIIAQLIPRIFSPQSVPKPLECLQCAGDAFYFEDKILADASARYAAIHRLMEAVVVRTIDRKEIWTERLDRYLLHKVFAFPFFFVLMYFLFFIAIRCGGMLQHGLEGLLQPVLIDGPMAMMSDWHWPDSVIHGIGYGLGQGLYTTLSFIPVMSLMYFLLSFLEASGYMARVAFVMDRLMQAIGLPGKAFVPLLIGFGCNVPAVIATRTLEAKQDRLLTILMMPFMSCSARLAIYSAFVAVVFPQGGHYIVFSLYVVGFLMAIMTGMLVHHFFFRGLAVAPLFLELPVYQMPSFYELCKHTRSRVQSFLWRAGRFIVPLSMVLSTLCAFDSAILKTIGTPLAFILSPMGIELENWPAAIGLLSGVFAKEVMMGTLNVLYHGDVIAHHFQNTAAVYAYLLFVSLYVPCISTMSAIRQESSRGWMWFSIGWSMILAYAVSVLFYQCATFGQHIWQTSGWLFFFMMLMVCYCLYREKRHAR